MAKEPAPHIATIDFPAFYAESFGGEAPAREFYASVTHSGSSDRHQAARMVWLADQIDKVSRGRPALQVMFFMIAAEAVAKLEAGYEGDRDSRKYVRRFFSVLDTTQLQERVRRALVEANPRPTDPAHKTADYLYEIRCDVVHRGQYFAMTLPHPDACIAEVRRALLETVVRVAQQVASKGAE